MVPFRRRTVWAAFVLVTVFLSASSTRADEDLYRKVAPSTALIYKNVGPAGGGSAGTGFLIDAKERLVVTARHVVENIGGGLAPAIFVVFAQTKDGDIITESAYYRNNWPALSLKAKVVYDSVRSDLAILQVDKLPPGIKPLRLATDKARPAQKVHLVGNSTERFGAVFSYSQGLVRNVFNWDYSNAQVVATQLPANKGDSGGPMVNNFGEVVGFASMSTTGAPLQKNDPFYETQLTEFSICVTEIHAGLKEMRKRTQLAKGDDDFFKDQPMQGEFKVGAKNVWLEKDMMYRIVVQADQFIPDLRIDNLLVAVTHTPRGFGLGAEMQHLFIPKETKEYRIQVAPYLGRDIGQGALPYTLAIEQLDFAPDKTIKEPKLKLNDHGHKLEAGKTYEITVKGKGFEPDVQIMDDTKSVLMKFNSGNKGNPGVGQNILQGLGLGETDFVTTLRFVPQKTKDYRILVSANSFTPPPKGPLDYTIRINEAKALLTLSDQLGVNDPLYPNAGPHKKHAVKLEVGKTYQIDLLTAAFDSQLLLEDSAGLVVMKGFDVEGFNASLVFRPTKSGTYHVVATAHVNNAQGAYTVMVSENPDAQVPGGKQGNGPGKK